MTNCRGKDYDNAAVMALIHLKRVIVMSTSGRRGGVERLVLQKKKSPKLPITIITWKKDYSV